MDTEEVFQQYRRLLFSIAYRMLGSVVDAEDIVQEAFLRWQQASGPEATFARPSTQFAVLRMFRGSCWGYLARHLQASLPGSPGSTAIPASSGT